MPSEFYVSLRAKPEQTGIAIKTETQPIPNKDGGISYQGIVHVLWDDEELASPAPSFHSPEELAHLGLVFDPDTDTEAEEPTATEAEGGPNEGDTTG